MMPALHIIALVAGGYLYCLTFVMRKSTEGQWLNRIEEVWIRVDDRGKAAGGVANRLVSVVGEKASGTLNRIVGSRILSPRLIGLSGSLSFASLFVFYGLFFEGASYLISAHSDLIVRSSPSGAALVHAVPLLVGAGIVSLLISGLCATLAILPVLFKQSIWAWLSCSPTALILVLFVRLLYLHLAGGKQFPLIAALAVSLASDVLLLVIVRSSLGWMLARTSIPRTLITVAIQLLLFFLVFPLPVLVLMREANAGDKGSLAVGALILGLFNVPTAMASVIFLFLLSVVLLHRVTWPLLSQLTYILTRSDVLDKRKTVRTVAGALILWGLSGLPGTLALVEVLEKILE